MYGFMDEVVLDSCHWPTRRQLCVTAGCAWKPHRGVKRLSHGWLNRSARPDMDAQDKFRAAYAPGKNRNETEHGVNFHIFRGRRSTEQRGRDRRRPKAARPTLPNLTRPNLPILQLVLDLAHSLVHVGYFITGLYVLCSMLVYLGGRKFVLVLSGKLDAEHLRCVLFQLVKSRGGWGGVREAWRVGEPGRGGGGAVRGFSTRFHKRKDT